jgi:hypothetical protein
VITPVADAAALVRAFAAGLPPPPEAGVLLALPPPLTAGVGPLSVLFPAASLEAGIADPPLPPTVATPLAADPPPPEIEHPLPLCPMITVGHPIAILFGGPSGSMIVSPIRDAGRLLISTVGLPSITTPGPCGGTGEGVTHAWISAPIEALAIAEVIAASVEAFSVCSAASAAGAPGVPAAAFVAASAI